MHIVYFNIRKIEVMHLSILFFPSFPLMTFAFDTSLLVFSITSPPLSEFHTITPSVTISNSLITSLPTSTISISKLSQPNHATQTLLFVSLSKTTDPPSHSISNARSLELTHLDTSQELQYMAPQPFNTRCQLSNETMAPLNNASLCENPRRENCALADCNSSISPISFTSSISANTAKSTSGGIGAMISSNNDSQGTDTTSEGASLWIFGFLGIVLAGSAFVGMTGAESVRE